MELEALIRSISEFGILIVIAGVYLIQNLRDNSTYKKDLGEVKDAISKLSAKNIEAEHNTIRKYELHEYISAFIKALKSDIVTEVLVVIANNNIHANEELTRRNFRLKMDVFVDKNNGFIDGKSCEGRALTDIISQVNLDELSDIALNYIYAEPKERKVINLIRHIDAVLGAFLATV